MLFFYMKPVVIAATFLRKLEQNTNGMVFSIG